MDDPAVVVRPKGGQPVALELRDGGRIHDGSFEGKWPSQPRLVMAKPMADLLPNSTYEVLDRVVNGCTPKFASDAGENCLLAEPAVIATFVTAASRDDVAPTFGGANVVNVGELEVCDSGGCCGPYSVFPVTLAWSAAADDHGAAFVRYNVYGNPPDPGATGAIVARFVKAEQLRGGIICGPPYTTPTWVALKGTYSVRAVDGAGNEDQNAATVKVEKACPARDDGGSPDATIDQGPPDGAGCSIARSRDVSGGSPFAFIALLLASLTRFYARTKGGRNRRSMKWGLGCLVVCALIGHGRAARACGGPGRMISRLVFPDSGMTDIPLNAEIRLTYRGGLTDDPAVVVRPAGGQPIALDLRDGGPDNDGPHASMGKVVLAKPMADLLPNTTYEILDRVVNGCRLDLGDTGPGCLLAEPAVIANFVTGASRDDAAPTFGGVNVVNVGDLRVCDQGGCCGPYSGFPVTLGWSPAADDHGAALVRYNVYSNSNGAGPTGAIVARFVDAQQLQGGIIRSPPPFGSGVINGGLGIALKGSYSVRAVDAAGNEDQNAATVEVMEPQESGCSIARSHHANAGSEPFFFALLLASVMRFYARTKSRRRLTISSSK